MNKTQENDNINMTFESKEDGSRVSIEPFKGWRGISMSIALLLSNVAIHAAFALFAPDAICVAFVYGIATIYRAFPAGIASDDPFERIGFSMCVLVPCYLLCFGISYVLQNSL